MIERVVPGAGTVVIATSIAIVAIVLLRPPVLRAFGAVTVLRLWWILPAALGAVLLPKEVAHETVMAGMAAGNIAPIEALPGRSGISWTPILVSLWLTGSFAMAAWYSWLQYRFARLIAWRGGRGSLPPMYAPAVVGALRPRLVLPTDFATQFDASERRLILLHERVHMGRRDGATNLLMALLTVLQWFNPLVHWAAHALRRDQESACDAIVIARHPGAVERYAGALMKALPQPRSVPLACTWHRTHPLVERISMLKSHRDLQPRSRVSTALLVASVSLVSALAYAAKPEVAVMAISQSTPAPAPAPAPAAEPKLKPTANDVAPLAPKSLAPRPKAAIAPRAPKAVGAPTPATNPDVAPQALLPSATPVPLFAPAPPSVAPDTRPALRSEAPARTASNDAGPAAFPPTASFASAVVKVTSIRLAEDDKVMVEMVIEDTHTTKVLGRPRLLVKLGKSFAISMGREVPGKTLDLLEATGTVEKEAGTDGGEYLRYQVEATPKSTNYFIDKGRWPVH